MFVCMVEKAKEAPTRHNIPVSLALIAAVIGGSFPSAPLPARGGAVCPETGAAWGVQLRNSRVSSGT